MTRDVLKQRLSEDLIGPGSASEVLASRPSDTYLTGILFPLRSEVEPEEDEELAAPANDGSVEESAGAGQEAVALSGTRRQSSAGLSFAAEAEDGGDPVVTVEVRCGTYRRCWQDADGRLVDADAGRGSTRWARTDHRVTVPAVSLGRGAHEPIDLGTARPPLPGMQLRIQVEDFGRGRVATVVMVNAHPPCDDRAAGEAATFFQTEMTVRAGDARSRLIPRPSRRSAEDAAAALIYRNAEEYAVGHTCSAAWQVEDVAAGAGVDGRRRSVDWVRTCWLPEHVVPAVSADGDERAFAPLKAHARLRPLSAKWLSQSDDGGELAEALRMLPDAYERWLDETAEGLGGLGLTERLRTQAETHIAACRGVARRMRAAVDLIAGDEQVRQAFRLANQAMCLQRRWSRGDPDLLWRPFQLGFQLLVLESLAKRTHDDRSTMDLLWFPTGGGKTEAYLALVAFVLFHRRLTGAGGPDRGAGVAVLMRYTLRLLSIQQFQRASALICACEHIRRTRGKPDLGQVPFSIGLWVGGRATPNTVKDAAAKLRDDDEPTPRQLTSCPACRSPRLQWYCVRECRKCGHEGPLHAERCARCREPSAPRQEHHYREIRVKCGNPDCEFVRGGDPHLPVWTVDDDIYRERPSLVLGTVDKFAQIARNPSTAKFFGRGGTAGDEVDPPDLIIQDELHLISGPLGTVAALYEIAIDALCARDAPAGKVIRPKVIGSTATIKAADAQIRALFDRGTCLFPPPVLDADNSCFARRDAQKPGRLYVGVTTAGRSPKFSLQAVCASALQSASSPALEEPDPYWTLIAYFNSLRELGGALVMMRDDVPATLKDYAARRGEKPREPAEVEELTSRKGSSEIPEILSMLDRPFDSGEAYDAILATNMISVGMDVPRLGLMVVNGQPKLIAEYIQATSRVGREHPGLVLSVYNNGKARDRSHFESFATWHATLYRDVEATSVTPFAPRAIDKALHAVLVTLARRMVRGLATEPAITPERRREIEAAIVPLILERVGRIDPAERPAVEQHIRRKLDQWERMAARWARDAGRAPAGGRRGRRADGEVPPPQYWVDSNPDRSLLMSAEAYVTRVAAGMKGGSVWPTPNSMRDVEPGSPFRLMDKLPIGRGAGGPEAAGETQAEA